MRRKPVWECLAAAALVYGMPACGQTPVATQPEPVNIRGVMRDADPFSTGGPRPELLRTQAIARAEEKKRHMAADSARLLELSRQLQADLQAHSPAADDTKRLDEIAKLARSIRDNMKQ